MDFSRSSSPQQPSPARASNGAAATNGGNKKNSAWRGSPLWLRVIWMVLLFSGTILAVALVILLYMGGKPESKFIDKEKFQAVFLTNGQVYFGTIKDINDKYIDLQNIYYLSVNQAVQPEQQNKDEEEEASVSLVKLGCELHGPVDRMVVNREQVTFWENLKTDGQVSQAIDKWVEQNPQGQKCTTGEAQSSLDVYRKEG